MFISLIEWTGRLVLVFIAATCACSEVTPLGGIGDPCTSRDDCAEGLRCHDDVCQPDPETDGDADGDTDSDSDADTDADSDEDGPPPCEGGLWCGEPPICCAAGEQCHEGQCAPECDEPRVLCGDPLQCCPERDICFAATCTTPGDECLDFADCADDEYCEPTLGLCLPIDVLPECEYRPPTGVFSPIVEWTFDPTTPPYIRAHGDTAFDTACGDGVALDFADDDEAVIALRLPRAFPFFGVRRRDVVVSTNGWLSFVRDYAGTAAPVNQAIADPAEPNALVAAYWDDLEHVNGCTVDDAAGGRFIVQLAGMVKTSGEAIVFQVILHDEGSARAGDIEVVYGSLGAIHDGDSATIGLEDDAGARANLVGYDRSGAASTTASLLFAAVPLGNQFDALSPPAVFDLDRDGLPEVIFVAYDDSVSYDIPNGTPAGYFSGLLTILNGEDGTVQARHQGDVYLAGGCAPSVGDVDGDGEVEIVALSSSDGRRLAVFDREAELEHLAADPISRTDANGWGGGVHIADLDADGAPELIYGVDVFDMEGHLLWSHDDTLGNRGRARNGSYGAPAIGDLDGDGELEVVTAAAAWNADGTPLWDRSEDYPGMVFPGIADFDGDGLPEVVLIGGGQLLIVTGAEGLDFWGPAPIDADGGPPNIGDFDNDGDPEVGTAGSEAYYVYDLECDGDNEECEAEFVRWSSLTKDASSRETGSSLFDFEGDGVAEVVYSDECYTRVYRGDDGSILFERPNNTRTATEYPLVVDVDGDNNAEILIVANEPVWTCTTWNDGHGVAPDDPPVWEPPGYGQGHRGLTVYGDAWDNWVRTRQIWSGHAYHISNIDSDGAIPRVEPPSWLSHNSWRMNAQGAGLFNAPDLVGELVVDDVFCAEHATMTLIATVRNAGALGVSDGVPVSFYRADGAGGWRLLGVMRTSEHVLPGGSTEVRYEYIMDPADAGIDIDFRIVVDWDETAGRGLNNECDEDNNEALATGRCDIIG